LLNGGKYQIVNRRACVHAAQTVGTVFFNVSLTVHLSQWQNWCTYF